MLWQAMADMNFRMPGGFAVIPGPTGANTFGGQPSPAGGGPGRSAKGARPLSPTSRPDDVRAQLRQWHTETVVVVPTAPGRGLRRGAVHRRARPGAADGRRPGLADALNAALGVDRPAPICGNMAPWHTTANSASPRS